MNNRLDSIICTENVPTGCTRGTQGKDNISQSRQQQHNEQNTTMQDMQNIIAEVIANEYYTCSVRTLLQRIGMSNAVLITNEPDNTFELTRC